MDHLCAANDRHGIGDYWCERCQRYYCQDCYIPPVLLCRYCYQESEAVQRGEDIPTFEEVLTMKFSITWTIEQTKKNRAKGWRQDVWFTNDRSRYATWDEVLTMLQNYLDAGYDLIDAYGKPYKSNA